MSCQATDYVAVCIASLYPGVILFLFLFVLDVKGISSACLCRYAHPLQFD